MIRETADLIDEPDPDAGRLWTPRRVVAATLIVAALAGEAAWALTRTDPWSARRAEVELLPENRRLELATKYERFENLPPAERERLLQLGADLKVSTSDASLRTLLGNYLTWKSQLSPQQSATLVGLDAEERFARVSEMTSDYWTNKAEQFSEADSKVVVAWLEKQVREHQEKLLENLPSIVRERFEQMGSRERTWALMYYVLGSARGPGPSRFDVVTPQALTLLRSQLSQRSQIQWDAAAKKPPGPDDLKSLLSGWIRTSIERVVGTRSEAGMPAMRIDENELRKFFETEIAETERLRLLALPRDEMEAELRREYLRRKGLWRDPIGTRFGPFNRGFAPGDERRNGAGGGRRGFDNNPPPQQQGPDRGFGPPPDMRQPPAIDPNRRGPGPKKPTGSVS